MHTDELDATAAHAIPDPRALARTYDHPSYADPWEAVLDHRRVMDAAANHPDRGSQAIASMLEIPRSRIRPWLDDGSMPAAARAVQVADGTGWLVRDLDTDAGRGLAGLVAWVFAGGSINQPWYVPYFAIRRSDEDSLDRLETVCRWYDVELQEADRADVDDHGRATEFRPTDNGSILGRCLAAAGAPVGAKSAADLSIPDWLHRAPYVVRQTFAAVYIAERATRIEPYRYQFREENRDDGWLRELGEFIVDVAGDGECWISSQNITFDKAATDALDRLVDTTF